MQQLHVFVSVNMSYYWPAKPILTSAFSIILQVSKNSYSLLQKHVIVLTVNGTYIHQQELMLNINYSYIVPYNRTYTNTRIIWSDLVCSQKLTISTKSYFCLWFHRLLILSLLMKYTLSSKFLFSLPNDGHNISSCY
jgi:hypothetical protein